MQKQKRRTELKENGTIQKTNKSQNLATEKNLFDVDDNLQLKVDSNPQEAYLSVELVDHLNNQIRELQDESGRLKKLLSERQFELKQARKKVQAHCEIPVSGVTNETAAAKIVELSRKVRELNSDVERERTNNRVLTKKCNDLESQNTPMCNDRESNGDTTNRYKDIDKDVMKETQEKLKQSELKLTELRNNNALLKHEIKLAQKIINQEVGDGVSIQSLSNNQSGWRGRAQQIIHLNDKITEMKCQIEEFRCTQRDSDSLSSRLSHAPSLVDKQRQEFRKIEKERKETLQKCSEERNLLQNEVSGLKQKLEGSKARSKNLTSETKSLKQQLKTLIDKGRNDDELIAALMKQQSALRELLTESQQKQASSNVETSQRVLQLSAQKQQDDAVVETLKAIIEQKESKLSQLEEDIRHIQLNKLQEAQQEGLNAIFNLQTETGTSPEQGNNSEVLDRTVVSDVYPALQSAESSRVCGGPVEQSTSVESNVLQQLEQVERQNLSEVVKVLQKRLCDAENSVLHFQSENAKARRKNNLLEKKLSQQNLVINAGKNASAGKILSELNKNYDLETMNTSLMIQQDENEAVKAALTSALKAKDEDHKMYMDMIEQTRAVIMKAVQSGNADSDIQ